jgi:tripartite-type tricarboxylate transporter receptor subunit TctC
VNKLSAEIAAIVRMPDVREHWSGWDWTRRQHAGRVHQLYPRGIGEVGQGDSRREDQGGVGMCFNVNHLSPEGPNHDSRTMGIRCFVLCHARHPGIHWRRRTGLAEQARAIHIAIPARRIGRSARALLAAKLQDSLGQPFVVENKTGASGSIGTAFAAKSPPDGYTFVFVFDTHAVNPTLIPNMPFDTVRDLAPVMLIGTAPMAIAVAPAKPYKNFADVINAAKAKPDAISYGSIGNGSLGHLTYTLVQQAGGFKLVHIPYKGGGPMVTDALGGQIEMAIGSVALLSAHVKGGKLRALAVTGDKRSSTMPDVPTLAEEGFPGFSALAWWGVFAPAGTPRAIIDKLNAEFARIMNQPEMKKQLTDQLGMDLVLSSPEALQEWTAGEIARWGKVVRDNGIRGD